MLEWLLLLFTSPNSPKFKWAEEYVLEPVGDIIGGKTEYTCYNNIQCCLSEPQRKLNTE